MRRIGNINSMLIGNSGNKNENKQSKYKNTFEKSRGTDKRSKSYRHSCIEIKKLREVQSDPNTVLLLFKMPKNETERSESNNYCSTLEVLRLLLIILWKVVGVSPVVFLN